MNAGVIDTDVGYTGGWLENPTYHDTHDSKSGHAESVRIEFDPSVLSYESLLEDWFFRLHDPTTLNRQGNDIGTQYRSAIFPQSDEQRAIAERGRYPAVNVLRSISRTMPGCVPAEVRPVLQRVREAMAAFADMEELIRLGAYRKGSDANVDRAIALSPAFEAFLSQQREERTSIADGYAMLEAIVGKAPVAG